MQLAFWVASAHCQLVFHPPVYQSPSPHCCSRSTHPPVCKLILGIVPTKVQGLALGLVELHDIRMGPLLKPVKVPLDGIPSLKHINCTTQIVVIFKLSGWRLNHFPGQPVPMLDNTFSEEIFPNIQSKPPLVQLEAISSCPMVCYLGEETDTHLSTTSFQTLHQLCCPSLGTLQHLSVSLVVRGPKLNTVFEVWLHQCQVQGANHFPTPAGHTISDTSQDAIGLLGHLGTLLAHSQLAVDQ
ncbi:hypothetical protein QYF61_021678 [Mycteria americana]|uniref:Uncharacterized protein n=1 Tax=Mycteria americana TaxID=33587 RepID=A0AAN7S504_MYCAM|nr:hypothetical protein QYF61_021678 [Mycteria americana]